MNSEHFRNHAEEYGIPRRQYREELEFQQKETESRQPRFKKNYHYEPQDHEEDYENENMQYESTDYQTDAVYKSPRIHSPKDQRPPISDKIAQNDEMLTLLIGEREETKEQKKERQRKYRQDLERQKKINEFYTRNLNPEVIERSHSRSPPKHDKMHDKRSYSPPSPLSNSYNSDEERKAKQRQIDKRQKYQEILHYQIREKEIVKELHKSNSDVKNMFARDEIQEQINKEKKKKELRDALEQQIVDKAKVKEEEKKKADEFERRLDAAIENMNKRYWEENKSESQREKEKGMYNEELKQQIEQKKMKDNFSEQQKKFYEIEEEK